MLYLTLKKARYALPTSWAELVPGKDAGRFIRMAVEMNLFEQGLVHFEHFQVAMTIAILGLRNAKVKTFSDEMAENIFRLGEQLTFPYHLRTVQDGQTYCDLTVILSENLLPIIHGTKGYRFHYDPSGRVDCDLTAERYIDALSLMQAWQDRRQPDALEALAKTLYPGLKKFRPEETMAIYYNFRGVLSWIRAIPAYKLIFTAAEDGTAPRKNPVGLASSIYSLSKAGYGPIESVKDLPLFDYLDLLLQQSIESIRTLSASQMKPVQIAERLGLPTELILEYTQ